MSVTAEQIRWCYVNLLGREPEASATIDHHRSVSDFPSLVLHFIRSPEFLAKNSQPTLVPLDAPVDLVETDVTPEQMVQLRQHVREAWTRLGKERPHYSVLTDDRFLPENIGQS